MSKLSRKKKLQKLPFFLNGLLFILGGIDFFSKSKIFFSVIQFAASAINITFTLPMLNDRWKVRLTIWIYIFNIIVAITVAIDYILQGKQYIQYAWFLSAFITGIALIVYLLKKRKFKSI